MRAQTVMGLDAGLKRTGIAIGNTLTRTAQALTVLPTDRFWEHLQTLVHEWQPACFVVGLPLNTRGQPTQGTRIARRLGQEIIERTRLPVHWVDERYSSVAVQKPTSKSGKMSIGLDAQAAALILQQYFDEYPAHNSSEEARESPPPVK
jgi:putative Holliday junction resolvase